MFRAFARNFFYLCHMNKSGVIVLAFLFITNVFGCKRNNSAECDSVDVIRLDTLIRSSGLQNADTSLDAVTTMKNMFGASHLSNSDFLRIYSNSNSVTSFLPPVESTDFKIPYLKQTISNAKNYCRTSLPELKFPHEIYFIISPYRQSIMLADSICFIASNHFLGYDFDGYDNIAYGDRIQKIPERIGVSLCEALIRSNYTNRSFESQSLLAGIAHEGAIYYILKKMTDAPLPLVLGMDENDLSNLKKTHEKLWDDLIEKSLLFSHDPQQQKRLFSAVPFENNGITYPPYTGRFLGYKLIERIASNNNLPSDSTLLTLEYASEPGLLQSAFR